MRLLLLCFTLLFTGYSTAETQQDETFELGIGLAYTWLPHYEGSDEERSFIVPFPYIFYQKNDLKINKDSVQAYSYWSGRVRFGFDYGIRLPLESSNNKTRQGMDNLDMVLLFGPKVEFCLTLTCEKDDPFRAYVSLLKPIPVDYNSFDQLDWVGRAGFKYDKQLLSDNQSGKLFLTASVQWQYQGADYSNYYYSVPPDQVRPGREFYSANNGFSNISFKLSSRWRQGNWWFGVFSEYIDLSDAVFVSSPMVKSTENWRVGIAFARVFRQ